MIKCPNCSAELEFDPKSKEVKCEYCGSKFDPKKLKTKVSSSKEEVIDMKNSYEGKRYTCSQCGASLLVFDETAITFCSYCGSQAMIESKMVRINNPDFIIPFNKTKEECIDNYLRKIRKSFFAPSYMKKDTVVNKFRGIYIPYCVYKVSFHNNCSNSGSKYNHRSGDYIYYDDYSVVVKTDSEYEGMSYDLVSKYYDKFSQSIPFDYKSCKEFNYNYLPGFYADTRDIDIDSYDYIAESIAEEDASNKLSHVKEIKKYNVTDPKVPLKVEERKTGMFPVYFLAIRDKDNKHINYAVINGDNGKVAADIPIDFKKYIFLTLLLTIFVFLLINSYLVVIPQVILVFSIGMALLSGIISNNQLNKMEMSKTYSDDLGVLSKDRKENSEEIENFVRNSNKPAIKSANKFFTIIGIISLLIWMIPLFILKADFEIVGGLLVTYLVMFGFFWGCSYLPVLFQRKKHNSSIKKKKMSFSEKLNKYLYKQLIGIVIGVVILKINPVNDIYYYGGSLIVLLTVILSFKDLVKERNEIVSNPLPQLNKRGGDENE